ncbi:GNAT family N-acetyltransferase [Streptomyces sp. TRM66268-LWL]|uniref:GNAT family N-acetyltransferase n=1 Tax=Streptomyces polyasparticus TaxID=2767826 RepID=A0ABR7SCZ5_9ACTN|nr:GNAT family N-acetyltransferase [Streptomyces polyasparticus]MBC9713044.1 GNAT family N-acetyltransferase [Streptomyces polyasparticus]
MTDLVIRALSESDASLFDTLESPGLVGRAIAGVRYATFAEGGDYRPEWTYVALRDDRVVARAAWWGAEANEQPVLLNWFDFADGEQEAGTELLRRAPFDVEYELMLPPDWRERPETLAAGRARIAAAEAAGMKMLVERYHYKWTLECGLPPRTTRLTFREERDDAVLFDVLRRVNTGSLDAHAQRAIEEHDLDTAAQEELDYIHWCPEAWPQLAYDAEGDLVGLHLPARVLSGHAAALIGVVPEQRGHGYAFDLLAESTHFLVDRGVTTIVAATDEGNFPMAAHFAKAGYPVVQKRINLV